MRIHYPHPHVADWARDAIVVFVAIFGVLSLLVALIPSK